MVYVVYSQYSEKMLRTVSTVLLYSITVRARGGDNIFVDVVTRVIQDNIVVVAQ